MTLDVDEIRRRKANMQKVWDEVGAIFGNDEAPTPRYTEEGLARIALATVRKIAAMPEPDVHTFAHDEEHCGACCLRRIWRACRAVVEA